MVQHLACAFFAVSCVSAVGPDGSVNTNCAAQQLTRSAALAVPDVAVSGARMQSGKTLLQSDLRQQHLLVAQAFIECCTGMHRYTCGSKTC